MPLTSFTWNIGPSYETSQLAYSYRFHLQSVSNGAEYEATITPLNSEKKVTRRGKLTQKEYQRFITGLQAAGVWKVQPNSESTIMYKGRLCSLKFVQGTREHALQFHEGMSKSGTLFQKYLQTTVVGREERLLRAGDS